jgi:hypothetical protein
MNFLGELVNLSNTDKHRVIHPVLVTSRGIGIPLLDDVQFRDCAPMTRIIDGQSVKSVSFALGGPANLNDKVLWIPVSATGKHPDVKFDASVACSIAFGPGSLDVITILDGIGSEVAAILADFDPVL